MIPSASSASIEPTSVSIEPKTVWSSVLDYVRARTDPQRFSEWFEPCGCLEVAPDHATISAPNVIYKEWIEKHYRALLHEGFTHALGRDPELRIAIVPPTASAVASGAVPPAPAARAAAAATEIGHGTAGATATLAASPKQAATAAPIQIEGYTLNPHYTFENFIVGPSNRLAHAASLAVTESPAQVYNPLFLHGGVGLGKTHLLQAICQEMLKRAGRELTIFYLSCESFVNAYIGSLQKGGNYIELFRERYRQADMLLVDDIHFLANKVAMQEEFFHTFNALYNAQKQIILSSDSTPADIPTLEQRLVSRFKWGLVAEIEPPLYETRVAIIERKARMRGRELPKDVVDFLATRLDTNVREIEGAVVKVLGHAFLENKTIDLAFARSVMRDLGGRPGHVGITDIMNAICTEFRLKLSDLQSAKRSKSIAKPRQIAMYLGRALTGLSLEEIGGHFGGRDHTTVLYAEAKMKELRETDADLRALLDRLTRELQRASAS